MRLPFLVVLALIGAGSPAHAQTSSDTLDLGYVEAIGHCTFGNVTNQSFGVEAGLNVAPKVQVFLDVSHVRNAAPKEFGDSAFLIAAFLSRTQNNVSYKAAQPITFGLAGLRYLVPTQSPVEPYVMGGMGIAQVTKHVSFTIGGTDVTSHLDQYGVVLGADLIGRQTKAMLTLGGGVLWPARRRFVLDLQYRYGRVFAVEGAIPVNRVGLGLGVRF